MEAIEMGIRELQRATSRVMHEVERGVNVLVTRQGRPVALLIPVASAAAWVLENRPLRLGSWEDEEDEWLTNGLLRVAPAAEAAFEALRPPIPARLVNRFGRLRRQLISGHVVVREGQVWALATFAAGDERGTLVAVGRRVELERHLRSRGRPVGQPM